MVVVVVMVAAVAVAMVAVVVALAVAMQTHACGDGGRLASMRGGFPDVVVALRWLGAALCFASL